MVKKRSKNQIVSGIVVPHQWDETGKIVRFAIQSFNEIEYLIERRKADSSLDGVLHQKVQVIGRVKERIDGRRTIRIRELNLM